MLEGRACRLSDTINMNCHTHCLPVESTKVEVKKDSVVPVDGEKTYKCSYNPRDDKKEF